MPVTSTLPRKRQADPVLELPRTPDPADEEPKTPLPLPCEYGENSPVIVRGLQEVQLREDVRRSSASVNP